MDKSEKVSLPEGNITTDTEKWTEKIDKLFILNRQLSWVIDERTITDERT